MLSGPSCSKNSTRLSGRGLIGFRTGVRCQYVRGLRRGGILSLLQSESKRLWVHVRLMGRTFLPHRRPSMSCVRGRTCLFGMRHRGFRFFGLLLVPNGHMHAVYRLCTLAISRRRCHATPCCSGRRRSMSAHRPRLTSLHHSLCLPWPSNRT